MAARLLTAHLALLVVGLIISAWSWLFRGLLGVSANARLLGRSLVLSVAQLKGALPLGIVSPMIATQVGTTILMTVLLPSAIGSPPRVFGAVRDYPLAVAVAPWAALQSSAPYAQAYALLRLRMLDAVLLLAGFLSGLYPPLMILMLPTGLPLAPASVQLQAVSLLVGTGALCGSPATVTVGAPT